MLESYTRPISHRAPNPDEFAKDLRKNFVGLDDHATTGEQILEWLALAQRPLILAGPATIRGVGKQILDRLSQVLKVPVLGMESPRGVNDPSLGALAEVLPEADLIILLGKKLDYTLLPDGEPLFNKDCRFIQFDPDMAVLELTGRALGQRQKQLMPLMTTYEKTDPGGSKKEQAKKTEKEVRPALFDPLPTAQQLINLASQREWSRSDWFDKVSFAIAFRPPEWNSLASSPGEPLHALEISRAVGQFLAGDDQAIFISDGGEFGQWAQSSIQAAHRIINGPSGAIGNAIPFAIAARLARPDAKIVAMTGDGALGFSGMEFDTAVRYELPFIAVVGNDATWNAEYQIQLREFGEDRAIGCQLRPSRYDEMVKALGGFGCHVQQATELRAALEDAHASNQPACINVVMQNNPAPNIRRNP
ncbi:MAG: hypothetical protein IH991_17265 [Planctomycetes bacterium]|nr:hypothetical protein [Planctomycetota bacterium]